jgi:tRNA/rRNA methyltransferase
MPDRAQSIEANGPAFILVEPQLGENVGACARAMLNCGQGHLRIVRPRDGWPNEKAFAAASGADIVLERAQLFGSLREAVADLHAVLATTARPRGLAKPVFSLRGGVADLRARRDAGEKVGIVFGPERAGLTTEDLSLCTGVLTAEINPAFSSLNLAHACVLVAHQWYDQGSDQPAVAVPLGDSRPATQDEFDGFMTHLGDRITDAGFFTNPEMKPSVMRNLRAAFARMGPSEQELRTLHGVIAVLAGRKWR